MKVSFVLYMKFQGVCKRTTSFCRSLVYHLSLGISFQYYFFRSLLFLGGVSDFYLHEKLGETHPLYRVLQHQSHGWPLDVVIVATQVWIDSTQSSIGFS